MTSIEPTVRILIVEDDGHVRTALTRSFDIASATLQMSIEVAACGDAVSALRQIQQNTFDVIVADFDLGGGPNGEQLITKALELSGKSYFVLLSGHEDDELAAAVIRTQARYARTGQVDFIQKPVRLPQAVACLQRAKRHLSRDMKVDSAARRIHCFVVVAAQQELNAIRRYNRRQGIEVITDQTLAERDGDIAFISSINGKKFPVAILQARTQGKSSMQELLNAIESTEQPKWIVLVGMMAAIKTKAKLLDVICPKIIYDGVAIGTKNGKTIVEPSAGLVDPVLHNYVATRDKDNLLGRGIKLIDHKHSVTVAAKIDDITHDLAQKALSMDPENIIGLEMEGTALVERQSLQLRADKRVGFIMLKGVADYAGERPDKREVHALAALGIERENGQADPTFNKSLKEKLQERATTNAYEVAIDVFRRAVKDL